MGGDGLRSKGSLCLYYSKKQQNLHSHPSLRMGGAVGPLRPPWVERSFNSLPCGRVTMVSPLGLTHCLYGPPASLTPALSREPRPWCGSHEMGYPSRRPGAKRPTLELAHQVGGGHQEREHQVAPANALGDGCQGVPRQPTLIFCEGFECSVPVGTRKMVNYA